jgi:hypothetical protein
MIVIRYKDVRVQSMPKSDDLNVNRDGNFKVNLLLMSVIRKDNHSDIKYQTTLNTIFTV